MRLEKLTTKSQEALQQAQTLADKRNHQAIDVEHLLFALLGQKEGVVPSLLQKLGLPLSSLTERLQKALDRLPQVTGATGQTFVTPRLKKIIEGAEAEAEALKDEYVSTEHLLLSMVQDTGEAGKVLRELGASRDKLLNALVGIRGAQRITDPNPEEKYQALEKYSHRRRARAAHRERRCARGVEVKTTGGVRSSGAGGWGQISRRIRGSVKGGS